MIIMVNDIDSECTLQVYIISATYKSIKEKEENKSYIQKFVMET